MDFVTVVRSIYCQSAVIFLLTASVALGQVIEQETVVSVRGVISFDKVYRGGNFRLAIIVDISEEWHINAHIPSEEFLIPTELKLDDVKDITFGQAIYPSPIHKSFAFSKGKLAVYQGKILIGVPVSLSQNFPLGKTHITGSLNYQTCNDQQCLPPREARFSVPIDVVNYDQPVNLTNEDIFSKINFGEAAVEKENEIGRLIREKGWFLSFFFIFLGGLALNLTPCVYPLIPITISYFGGQSQAQLRKTFILALFYVLGLAITYSALGVIAASTGNILGASLQNPIVLGFVSGVLVILALSMFGLYEIRVPTFLTNLRGGARKGIGGTLFMGLTVGIVAAPCIGPFVLGLLIYIGTTGNPLLGFGMFFTFAMGLGLPFLFLGIFSGTLNSLPRSGMWMVWVRKIFGFVLIGMAIFFLRPLIPSGIYRFLIPLLVVAGGAYLGWIEKSIGTFNWVKRGTGLLAIAFGVWLFIPGRSEGIQWTPYSDELLIEAKQNQTPVIIDFYAEWCLPCKELDRFTYSDPEVTKYAEWFLTLKADLTKYSSPAVERLKEKYDIRGVPTVVFINSQGQEVEELRVVEFVKAEEFLKRMKSLRD